jgi:hypothetical protein
VNLPKLSVMPEHCVCDESPTGASNTEFSAGIVVDDFGDHVVQWLGAHRRALEINSRSVDADQRFILV